MSEKTIGFDAVGFDAADVDDTNSIPEQMSWKTSGKLFSKKY